MLEVSRIKKNNLEVWLPLMDDTRVKVRHISQREFDEIGDQAKKITFNPKSHVKEEVRDEKQFRSLLARAVVMEWEGIEEEGQPYPCTPENIDYLMEECTEFRMLVMDTPLSLERMLAAEREAQRKN